MAKKDQQNKGSKVPSRARVKPKELGPEEVAKLTGGLMTGGQDVVARQPVAGGYSCPRDCDSLTVIMPKGPSELTVKL